MLQHQVWAHVAQRKFFMTIPSPSSSGMLFAGSRKFAALENTQKPGDAPSPITLFESDLFDPLMQRHGHEFLQEAVQHYVQAKDSPTQAQANSWIHQLLRRGVKPNPTRQANFAVVNPAIQANKHKLKKLLKEHGAEVPTPEAIKAAQINLNQAVQSKEPITPDQAQKFENALTTPGIKPNQPPNYKTTLLGYAARQGHIALVNALLHARADVNLPGAGSVNTPLGEAAEAGHTAIAHALLKAGAQVNIPDQYQRTPLHWAALNGHTDIVKLLLDYGADATLRDHCNRTPLEWVQGWGHPDVAGVVALLKSAKRS
jgi:ankyrin repeat protein